MGGKVHKSRTNDMHAAVASVLANYPTNARARLLAVRALIFETASALKGVGELTETLKWGEVSYLTEKSKSGSTIRIGWRPSQPENYAVFLNCNTKLISEFRTAGISLNFEGNRAIVMPINAPIPQKALRSCIEAALTYHQDKR